MSKTFKIVGNDISDGYHTFDELYDHRCLLFINLCLVQPECAAWKTDPNTDGWFLLYLQMPKGQISYHIPLKYFDMVNAEIKNDSSIVWDGHTSADVLERLQ